MAEMMLADGDIVHIKLIGGREIEAEFVRKIDENIIVKNSKNNIATQKIRRSNQTYYKSEIKSIHVVHVAAVINENTNESGQNNNTTENGANEISQFQNVSEVNADKKKSLSEQEILNIQESMKSTIHIAQHDDNYHSAINDLKKQEIISLTSENRFGRLDLKRPLMTMATASKVYQFDMARLGPMKKELKEIFSSKLPRKIIHSTAEFADYLRHTENCALNGTLDTLMVHFTLKKTRQPIHLEECFTTYFDLPDDFILRKFNYQIRPLAEEAKIFAASKTALLMKLYWHMNDILMKPLHMATAQFSHTHQAIPNQVDVMVCMNKQEYPGIENIKINAAELLEEEFVKLLQTE